VSTEENKRLVRRLVEEALAQHDPDVVDEIYIFHVRDGKLSSAIGVEDNLTRMRQLGIRVTN
jgi:hypothetical protein